MLTDEEIKAIYDRHVVTYRYDEYARAIEKAVLEKEQRLYTQLEETIIWQASEIARLIGELQIVTSERDNIKSGFDRLKSAFDEWMAKTDWVLPTLTPKELGMHRADILKQRLEAK